MAAPLGNTNGAKRQRLLTDALKRHLVQNPEDAKAVTAKLIECAKNGESWAQVLIHDRVDGKVPQPVVGGDDDETPIKVSGVIELVRPA